MLPSQGRVGSIAEFVLLASYQDTNDESEAWHRQ